MRAAPPTGFVMDRHIKLLRYQPRASSAARLFGAIWQQQDGEIRWTSPIIPEHEHAPDLRRFAEWFPEATYDFDQFAAAVAWLQLACTQQCELLDIVQACNAKAQLGLSCVRYLGPGKGADLATLLDEGGPTRLPDVGLLRAVVTLTLLHLVAQHPVLQGLALEILAEKSAECARLALPNGKLIRIYLDRDTSASQVAAELLARSAQRSQASREPPDGEVSFFVFAQLRSALPVRPSAHVLATGMRLPHIANGLVRLV